MPKEYIVTDASSKWLQSSGLLQDFELYGSKLNRNSQRSGIDPSPEASAEREGSAMIELEHSPGLLDLHSFDTELLPEMHVRGKSFDDYEPFVSMIKLTGRSRGLPENNLLKSL